MQCYSFSGLQYVQVKARKPSSDCEASARERSSQWGVPDTPAFFTMSDFSRNLDVIKHRTIVQTRA